jgi:hypothetical protein
VDDKTRQAIEDGHNLRSFMASPGGEKCRQILEGKIDEMLNEMSSASTKEEKRPPEFYGGAIHALKSVIYQLYGCLSYGERVRIRAEEASKREVENDRKSLNQIHRQPRPARRGLDRSAM